MRNILVIQLARFGDLVQTKRLMLTLSGQGAAVHLAVDKALVGLARLLYPFAQVHAVPSHATGTSPEEAFIQARKAFRGLVEANFEAVYNLNISPLSLALCSLFPPEIMRGYALAHGQALRSHWCRLASRWTADRKASPLNLVDFWAHFHPHPMDPLRVNPKAEPSGSNRVGVVLAGRQSRRSLSVPVLAKTVQTVFEAHNGPELVCFGSRQETPLARRLARELSPQAAQRLLDTTGRTALEDLPELVGSLDMLLTPDTGLMHLAAHAGVPVQAFFLSSAWAWETGPYGLGHTIWQTVHPCAPCLENQPCPRKEACLQDFVSPGFHERLALRVSVKQRQRDARSPWPEDLVCLESAFDPAGAALRPVLGRDPYAAARQAGRLVVQDCLGLEDRRTEHSRRAAELFYESDWMLPDPVPARDEF